MEVIDQRGRKRSIFEDIWFEKEECFEIIRQTWSEGGPIRNRNELRPKFDEYRRSLPEWSKWEFKHNVIEINKVKNRLNNLGNQIWGQARRTKRELSNPDYML